MHHSFIHNTQDETNTKRETRRQMKRARKRESMSQRKHLGMRLDIVTAVTELKLSLQNSQLKVQHNYSCSDHRKESF